MRQTLPINWEHWRLSDVGDWLGGGTPSSSNAAYWDGDIPWVSPKDMKVSQVTSAQDQITRSAIENSAVKLISAGSVLFVTRSGILAHSFPVATTKVEVTVNQDLKAITPVDVIDHDYLAWLLRAFERQILSTCSKHGTTVHSIEIPALKDLRVPIPPPNEQRRIVAKIEELLSELDKGVESLKVAQEQLGIYRQAALDAAVSGQLLVQRGRRSAGFGRDCLTPIEGVVNELGQGWSPRCHNHPTPNYETWGVIKTTAIQHLAFDDSENKELPDHLEPKPHLALQAGDILITRAGPRSRAGVACLVRACRPRLMLCDKAYRVRADERKILPEYLAGC